MNPIYNPEKEPLRTRSDTFIRIEEFANDFRKSKGLAAFLAFMLLGLALANMGTSVAANILTRKVTIWQNASDSASLTTTNGIEVSTLTTMRYGVSAECSSLESMQQSSSISVNFSPLDNTNIFTAHVASVLTIPVPQSPCGYYLLVRTLDPLYDVVVADNVTSIIGKEKGNALIQMSIPKSDNTRVYMTTFESTFASTSSSVNPSLAPSSAPIDAEMQEQARLTAIGIWASSMFLSGQLECGQSVSLAAIPALVMTRSGQCPITNDQLNTIGNLFASGSSILAQARQKLAQTPECVATVSEAITDMQTAYSGECDAQLLTILHLASNTTVDPSKATVDRANAVRAIVDTTTDVSIGGKRHLSVTFKAGGKPSCDYCECIQKSKTSCSISISCLIGTAIDNLIDGWERQAKASGYQW